MALVGLPREIQLTHSTFKASIGEPNKYLFSSEEIRFFENL
jgi:hypothetical protein